MFGNPFLLIFQIPLILLNIRMRYGGSKLKKPEKRDFYGIFITKMELRPNIKGCQLNTSDIQFPIYLTTNNHYGDTKHSNQCIRAVAFLVSAGIGGGGGGGGGAKPKI